MEFIGEDLLEGYRELAPFVVDGETIGVPFNLQQLVDAYGKVIRPIGYIPFVFEDQLVYVGMSKYKR